MTEIKKLTRPLIVKGRLIYNEARRACSIIRFKTKILDEFPDLRSGNWSYQLEHWKDYPTTIERLKEAQDCQEKVPMLLFIYKESDR